jgi:transposase
VAKELLRDVYSAAGVGSARGRLAKFYTHCADADVAELTRLAKTVRAWEDEILAYHRCGLASNGPTEAVNLGETVRRTGRGFRNFDNFRLRLLLALGVKWHTPPAVPEPVDRAAVHCDDPMPGVFHGIMWKLGSSDLNGVRRP